MLSHDLPGFCPPIPSQLFSNNLIPMLVSLTTSLYDYCMSSLLSFSLALLSIVKPLPAPCSTFAGTPSIFKPISKNLGLHQSFPRQLFFRPQTAALIHLSQPPTRIQEIPNVEAEMRSRSEQFAGMCVRDSPTSLLVPQLLILTLSTLAVSPVFIRTSCLRGCRLRVALLTPCGLL